MTGYQRYKLQMAALTSVLINCNAFGSLPFKLLTEP